MVERLLVDPSALKSLGRIAGCETAKRALEGAAYIYTDMPHLIEEGYGCKNILLHGSPGTGKTTLAQALAVESKMPCYYVSISHLVEKWIGASEKNVRYLFEIANAHAPSIIIFDKVDAICGVRRSNDSNGPQRMTSELLTCMSRFPKVMVVGTTNLPWALDLAFLQRFQKHIFVSLPTESERCDLVRMLLVRYPNNLTEADIKEVAKQTDGFTGEALERCIDSVADDMAIEIRTVTHFQQVDFRGQQRYAPAISSGIHRDNIPDRSLVIPGPFDLDVLLATVEQTASERGVISAAEEKHAKWNKEKSSEVH